MIEVCKYDKQIITFWAGTHDEIKEENKKAANSRPVCVHELYCGERLPWPSCGTPYKKPRVWRAGYQRELDCFMRETP